MKDRLIQQFEKLVTKRRKQLIDKVIRNRTRYITVAIEDIYQPQNASAILRTCDCLGIQDVHIIENKNKYNVINEIERTEN